MLCSLTETNSWPPISSRFSAVVNWTGRQPRSGKDLRPACDYPRRLERARRQAGEAGDYAAGVGVGAHRARGRGASPAGQGTVLENGRPVTVTAAVGCRRRLTTPSAHRLCAGRGRGRSLRGARRAERVAADRVGEGDRVAAVGQGLAAGRDNLQVGCYRLASGGRRPATGERQGRGAATLACSRGQR